MRRLLRFLVNLGVPLDRPIAVIVAIGWVLGVLVATFNPMLAAECLAFLAIPLAFIWAGEWLETPHDLPIVNQCSAWLLLLGLIAFQFNRVFQNGSWLE